MFVLCNDFIVYMFDAIYFAFNFKINFGMENHAFYNMSYIFKHKAVNMPKESKDKITYMYNLSKRETKYSWQLLDQRLTEPCKNSMINRKSKSGMKKMYL